MMILVSVSCTAYNHEKYIACALDSFLMQKTNFDYEIIVGEDCSTDATRQIILDYQKKYPEKIKMITSASNVGAQENSRRLREKARGRYIALCDGDDFWTDPHKLQKQVDYMERQPNCTMCAHGAEIVDDDGRKTDQLLRPHLGSTVYDLEDMIKTYFKLLFATSSILYRRDILADPPQWFYQSPVGDYPLSIICASQGFVGYIDEIMSAYRRGVSGSWCDVYERDKQMRTESLLKFDQLFEEIDQYTAGKYAAIISRLRAKNAFRLLFNLDDARSLKQWPFIGLFAHLTIIDKCRVFLKLHFPSIYRRIVLIMHLLPGSGRLIENTKQEI